MDKFLAEIFVRIKRIFSTQGWTRIRSDRLILRFSLKRGYIRFYKNSDVSRKATKGMFEQRIILRDLYRCVFNVYITWPNKICAKSWEAKAGSGRVRGRSDRSTRDHEYERKKTGASRLASNRVRTLPSFVSTLVANEPLFLGSRIGLESSLLRIRCAFLAFYFEKRYYFDVSPILPNLTTKNKLDKYNCNNTIDDPFVNFWINFWMFDSRYGKRETS